MRDAEVGRLTWDRVDLEGGFVKMNAAVAKAASRRLIPLLLDRPDWAGYRRQLSDHHQIADFFFGDYFPLTPYGNGEEVWMA